MINGVHHVAVSTPDAERMLAYYRDLLGFEVVFDFRWEPGTEMADEITDLDGSAARQLMFRAGNCYLEVFEYHSPPPKPRNGRRPVNDHGITHFAFDVTDIDAEYERLTAAGMEFHSPPVEPGPGRPHVLLPRSRRQRRGAAGAVPAARDHAAGVATSSSCASSCVTRSVSR